jgi:ADP-dependent NAD(P)H-hydrate dehydratase
VTGDLPLLFKRDPESHKGDFGRALLVAGSKGMAGAAALAGIATLRGGAGLVRLAVPEPCLGTVAGFEPSYMTTPLSADRAGRIAWSARSEIAAAAEEATVVAFGPGVGRSPGLSALGAWLFRHLAKPMVFDADGLFALAASRETLGPPPAPRILTPHPGEFARLIGGQRLSLDQREAAALELAARWQVVLVLKGHRTLVTNGTKSTHNTTGNPGMATGGSGDVLTGLITALACQGLVAFEAARLGVYLHGLAGDLAAMELSQEAMIASDLVRYLPQAFQEYRRQNPG